VTIYYCLIIVKWLERLLSFRTLKLCSRSLSTRGKCPVRTDPWSWARKVPQAASFIKCQDRGEASFQIMSRSSRTSCGNWGKVFGYWKKSSWSGSGSSKVKASNIKSTTSRDCTKADSQVSSCVWTGWYNDVLMSLCSEPSSVIVTAIFAVPFEDASCRFESSLGVVGA
jgi:hypothetical protein